MSAFSVLPPSKDRQDFYEERRLTRRIRVVQALFVAVLILYVMAFWYLQVVKADHYLKLSDNNRLRRVTLRPMRGVISDRERRLLASNRIAFNIRLDREAVPDMKAFLPEMSGILMTSEETLRNRLSRYRSRPAFIPVVLKEDVDLAEAAYIESRRLELPMLSVDLEARRFYQHGPLAAHILGHVGEASDEQIGSRGAGEIEMGEIIGQMGLERSNDDALRGRRGWKQVVVNSLGRTIQEVDVGRRPTPGHAIRLTIDMDLQRVLEEAFGDEAGSGVFLDPQSGEVLAMASMPGFDPNVFAGRFSQDTWNALMTDRRHPLQNRASVSKFAPGSIFKIVMAIAALEDGFAGPDRVENCTGSWRFGRKSLRCWTINRGGHGSINLREAIVHSCNIYFYKLGHEMGIERIARWARAFGFGSRTGIDLPHEEAGNVPDPEWEGRAVPSDPTWHPGETVSVSIGQGALEVTPLQMAVFAAAISNGGILYRPHIVLAREVQEGVEERVQDNYLAGRVELRPRTLQLIKNAMWGVVNADGTGSRARLNGRDVCGKTGTAQVARAARDIDADKMRKNLRSHAWFIGFAPRDDPKIAWAVFVQNGGHGGTIAAPIARAVLERFFEKLDVKSGGEAIARASALR
ncbi:MAG: penicillin-binding protein 2 [Acidobacteria bacterium]|nr:penicillin-binding protein 2 [Acidobacteriota bacterium]